MQAYSRAVRAALEAARVIERALWPVVEVELGRADAGRAESALRRGGVEIVEARYEDIVILTLAVPDAVEIVATDCRRRFTADLPASRPTCQP